MTAHVLSARELCVRRGGRRVLGPLSVTLAAGGSLGVIGASGSGKSTLLRALAGLLPVQAAELSGSAGTLLGIAGPERRRRQRRIALVFQEPRASLNPCRTVGSMLEEVLAPGSGRGQGGAGTVASLLEQVGLEPALRLRLPSTLSLGQCQRVQVARALAQAPDVLLLDEVTSALDSIASRALVQLLLRLRAAGTALVLASHDLALVESLCDELLVLEQGQVVDRGATRERLASSTAPVTRALVAAGLPLVPARARERLDERASGPP